MTAALVLAVARELLAPLVVVLGAAQLVVVVLLVGRWTRRRADPVEVLRRSGPVGRWRVEHGPAVDAWLAAYRARFAGLAEALAGREALRIPDPVDRLVELAFEGALDASPDVVLAERLGEVQVAAQAALVATVAGRMEVAATEYERYLAARAGATDRLAALALDPEVIRSPDAVAGAR